MPLFEKNEDEARYSEEVEPAQSQSTGSAPSAMDDLLGLGDIGSSAPPPISVTSNMAALNDLLGGPITSTVPQAATSNSMNGLMGLIDTPMQAAAPPTMQAAPVQTAAVIPEMSAWSNEQIEVKFSMKRENNILKINLKATNLTLADSISDFVFQGQTN